MDKTERERIRKLNALRFENLEKITIKKAVTAKQEMKKALATLNGQKSTYSAEYIAEQTRKFQRQTT